MSNENNLNPVPSANVTGDNRMIPFGLLRRSADNVRTINPDKEEDKRLVVSIKTFGLLQNLVVTDSMDGAFDVPAGGRRLGALETLFKKGEITELTEISCKVISTDQAVASSLAENEDRAEMHPADRFRAYKRLIDDGQSVETIAATFSSTVSKVEKILRLAGVHKKLFDLFAKDKMNFEVIASYAITGDTKHQLAVFKQIGVDAAAWMVKRAITEGQEASDSVIARYVGVDAYEAAGGALEQDLLGERMYLKDCELLNFLAEEKLNKALKRESGWKWCEMKLSLPSEVYSMARIAKSVVGVPDEIAEQLKSARSVFEELENDSDFGDDEWTEEQESAYERAEINVSELEAVIEKKYTRYSESNKANAGVIVTIGANAKTEFHRGLQRPADVKAARAANRPAPSNDDVTVANGINTNELSNSLTEDLLRIRRAAIKTALMKKPALAQTVLNYSLCSKVLEVVPRWEPIVLDASFGQSSDETSVEGDTHYTAIQLMAERQHKLDLSWINHETRRQRFEAFQTLSRAAVQALVGYCVGVTVIDGIDVSDGPEALEALEALVEQLEVDVSTVWRPGRDNYFTRLKKAELMEHGVEFYGGDFAKTHAKSKKPVLVEALDAFFHDKSLDLTDDQTLIRKTWLPVLIG